MKYVLSVLFSSIFFLGFSQNYFDIVNLTYTNTPPNDFEISNTQTTVEELADLLQRSHPLSRGHSRRDPPGFQGREGDRGH